MSVGITGVSIAPELGLHFHEGSLSFFEKCCCCSTRNVELPAINEPMYIDRKMRARRTQDVKHATNNATTHARLKLLVIEVLEPISDSPFEDAKQVFKMAKVDWKNPEILRRGDLMRVNEAMKQVKASILSMPIEVENGQIQR
jgi:hypothetical protein